VFETNARRVYPRINKKAPAASASRVEPREVRR